MKYLLVLIVVVVGLWLLLRQGRSPKPGPGRRAGSAGQAPDPMLQCRHCGVHLPPDEAVRDDGGLVYCSDAHRLAGPR